MKKQLVNPYLPANICIPDGEPKVYGDRVYLYGSHDIPGTKFPCQGDYQCWSAPVDDLSAWRNEGIIYRRQQDPYIKRMMTHKLCLPFYKYLFAPDVVEVKGRWYLYYGVGMSGAGIGVAVADQPTGPFNYLGRVHYPGPADLTDVDGDDEFLLGKGQPMFTMPLGIPRYHLAYYPYDPAVLYDNGRLFLYFGYQHCYVTELSLNDMRTMVKAPEIQNYISPDFAMNGGGWRMENGASIRKYDDRYYLSYYATKKRASALCYATAVSPFGPFSYQGVLVSLGDSAFHQPTAYLGTTHGGMFYANGHYYQNFHRQTGSRYSDRQAWLVELKMNPNGAFSPAKFTSQVQRQGGLAWDHQYQAASACVFLDRNGKCQKKTTPYLMIKGRQQCVTNLRDGSIVGFKYLDFRQAPCCLNLTLNFTGKCQGIVELLLDRHIAGKVIINKESSSGKIKITPGIHSVCFRFKGLKKSQFLSFKFSVSE